jgi:hypothetical protein
MTNSDLPSYVSLSNSDLPSYVSLSPAPAPAARPATPIQSRALPPPGSPAPESPQSACFFSTKNGRYKKTYPLPVVTGRPGRGYLTMVWKARDQPSPKRLESWLHLRPPRVRKSKLSTSSAVLTNTQEDIISQEEEDDDDDENSEFRAAMATFELDRANHKFKEERRRIRDEISEYYSTDSELIFEDEFEEGREARKFYKEVHLAQRVEAWVEEVKEARPWGQGPNKRPRPSYNENEEDEEEPPSPPTKRAKLKFPCVVPSCDKGYKSKASLQRHVYNDHVGVYDPVVRRACRLLWGETYKGGKLEEINQRFGEYPEGA